MTAESPNVRHIVAVAIGNALEWYDFAIYGYVAGTRTAGPGVDVDGDARVRAR